jgi:hypothetical protein
MQLPRGSTAVDESHHELGIEANWIEASNMNLAGILIGAAALIIIGVFHPIVVQAEYRFGVRIWPVFLVVGLAAILGSALLENITLSAVSGVFGFACLWSIRELFEQEERVEKGWFPGNPDRR